MRRVAILISGRGSNMTALIEAARADGFPAEIALVISNKADAPGLATAANAGVDTLVIESKPFGRDRAGFETVLQKALDDRQIELICLGGFMRLFTAEFVQAWYGRMLNIHPSLLPSFPGLDPHGQALRAGVKISGATVHFVMQGAVAVADDDTADTLAARVLGIEHRIYPQALRLLATNAIRIDGDVCRIHAGASIDNDLISPTLI
jgi:phosphoribosylglycinamide formyltransferase-1